MQKYCVHESSDLLVISVVQDTCSLLVVVDKQHES